MDFRMSSLRTPELIISNSSINRTRGYPCTLRVLNPPRPAAPHTYPLSWGEKTSQIFHILIFFNFPKKKTKPVFHYNAIPILIKIKLQMAQLISY